MAVALILILLIYSTNGQILVADTKNHELANCVSKIINEYFDEFRYVTFVDIESREDLLQNINGKISYLLVSRTPHVRMSIFNHAYLIHAANTDAFVKDFEFLTKERDWNPRSKFLIVLNEMDHDPRPVFDKLLKHHVINVLLLDGRENMNMYTYEPFENFGCGKRYDRIVHYGTCLQPSVDNLYPDKMKTGLRNCTINVEAAHWPPFSANPEKLSVLGVEQFVLDTLGEIEHFKLNYTYVDNAESFSVIHADMKAVGALESLQNNEVDIAIGGMVLAASRTEAFDYIWGHLPSDEFIVLVQKSRDIADWKYVYIEFPASVWALLFVAFVVYSVLMVLIFKIKDKTSIVLKMFDTLLSHGVKAKLPNCVTKLVLIHWIWFAYLIGLHYQTSLTSYTTHPLNVYQVSSLEDLKHYKHKSCMSEVMQLVFTVEQVNFGSFQNYSHGCHKLWESISTVSETDKAFTVSFSAVYSFYKNDFCDVIGCKLYTFKQPLSRVLHSIYLYKGFPMLQMLHQITLRLRENGLIEYLLANIYTSRDRKYKEHTQKIKSHFVIPWYVGVFGTSLSLLAFVVELIMGRCIKSNRLINGGNTANE